MTNYNWVDNPTENGVAICDPDILNECLMHLKYDNQKITKMYGCFNSGNVNSVGNSDLIETQESSKVILNVPGTYNLNIPVSGYYQIVLVGGGGNGQGPSINYAGMYSYCGGGSGAAFAGEVYLNSGSHSIKVGGAGGNSTVDSLIVAGGSTNAGMSNYNMQRAGGYGGTLTISSSAQIQNVTVQKNGNNGGFSNVGTAQAGGTSVYQGYGKGADSSNQGRTNGYFSIIIPSFTNNVVYKVGGNYKPLSGTLADGTQFTLNGVNSDNVSNLANGSYKKFVGADGSSELLNNTLTTSKTEPLNPSANDVWINNAVSPLSVKKYVSPNYTNNGVSISSDGIASNFAGGNVLNTDTFSLTSGNTFSLEGTFNSAGNKTNFSTILTMFDTVNNVDKIQFGADNNSQKLMFRYPTSATTSSSAVYNLGNITYNETHVFKIDYDGTALILYVDNVSIYSVNVDSSYFASTYRIEIGNDSYRSLAQPFYGSIDLKEFKIYVDDVLFYQPNFLNNGWVNYDKIPLGKITVSSGAVTGVESYPYNIDYISNNIVKSYKNGNAGYQIYADGYCVQWGRADSANGGTVTLPVDYSDTCYNIQLTSHRGDSNYDTTVYVIGRLKGSFDWSSTTNYTAGMNWVTFGYKK